jgi:hypothetical protein
LGEKPPVPIGVPIECDWRKQDEGEC